MEYRKLGRTGIEVSAVSLGTEYIFTTSLHESKAVVDAAIEGGVNYFDLFYGDPDFRDKMGKVFEGRRERVLLTAHLGATVTDGQADKTRDSDVAAHFFEDYLKRLQTDYVDVLFLHNSDGQKDYDLLFREGGLADLAERYVREGKARAVGLSGHTISNAGLAAGSGRVDVIMFPVNLAGHAIEGKAGFFDTCRENGVAVVAMKPFAGGALLQGRETIEVDEFLLGAGTRKVSHAGEITPVECLSYVLSNPAVSTALPGCKSVEEVTQALAWLDSTGEERDYSSVLSSFAHYVEGECVYCNHCLPCPSEIDIGALNRLLDTAGSPPSAEALSAYGGLSSKASDCIECGECEARCPFSVEIISRMQKAAETFEK